MKAAHDMIVRLTVMSGSPDTTVFVPFETGQLFYQFLAHIATALDSSALLLFPDNDQISFNTLLLAVGDVNTAEYSAAKSAQISTTNAGTTTTVKPLQLWNVLKHRLAVPVDSFYSDGAGRHVFFIPNVVGDVDQFCRAWYRLAAAWVEAVSPRLGWTAEAAEAGGANTAIPAID